jgi:hypothetical protein
MGATEHGTPVQQLPDGRRAIVLDSWFTKPAGRGAGGRKYQEHVEVYSQLTYADDTTEEFVVRLWPRDGDVKIIMDQYVWNYWRGINQRTSFEQPLIAVVRQNHDGVWKLEAVIPAGLNFREWLAPYQPSEDLLDWLAELEPISDVEF